MQRLLSHMTIPKKPHYQMVGLYHGKCREKLNEARKVLGQAEVKVIDESNWQEFMEKQYGNDKDFELEKKNFDHQAKLQQEMLKKQKGNS